MLQESDLNNLASNILNENHFSNCRLCLKAIDENYIRLQDMVCLDSHSTNFLKLTEVLIKLFGEEICHNIAGIDAVCMNCIDNGLKAVKFIQTCENSTTLLDNVFQNLADTLNIDIDSTNVDDCLYITVNEHESKLVLVKKDFDQRKHLHILDHIKCYECDEVIDDLEEFKIHNLSMHEKFTCEKCLETFTDETLLSQHENSETDYKCPDCNQYKCTEESLKLHQDKCHNILKDCGKSFRGIDNFKNHEQKHVTKSQCPKCGKSYSTKGFFLKHVKLCIRNMIDPHPMRSKYEKLYSCNKCGKGYSTPGGLRVHQRFVHGNAKPHTCKFCNKQFTAPSYLKVHMIKHTGEKNFTCDLCNGKFVSKEALLYHTRRHTGEKPYSCHLCNEKFVNSSARAEHIKFKHVGPTLMCEICSRKFVTLSFLRQHIKKHHDPTNKLYTGRCLIPPNEPGEHNIRVRLT